jgi:hypothetical protein
MCSSLAKRQPTLATSYVVSPEPPLFFWGRASWPYSSSRKRLNQKGRIDMSLTAQISVKLSLSYGNRPLEEVKVSPNETDKTFDYAGELKSDKILTCAASGTKELYDSGDELTDFDFILIESDQDGFVILKGSAAANNSTFAIKAKVPFMMGADQIHEYKAAADFSGTALDIAKIVFLNSSTTAAAKIRVILLT